MEDICYIKYSTGKHCRFYNCVVNYDRGDIDLLGIILCLTFIYLFLYHRILFLTTDEGVFL